MDDIRRVAQVKWGSEILGKFQEKDNQYNSAPEAGTNVACWRDGMIQGEIVGDQVRERERAWPWWLDKDFEFYSVQSVMESCMKVLSKEVLWLDWSHF